MPFVVAKLQSINTNVYVNISILVSIHTVRFLDIYEGVAAASYSILIPFGGASYIDI